MKPKQILQTGIDLLQKKGEDYTHNIEINQFENFEKQAIIADWFERPVDKVFATMLAVKLARLSALLNTNKIPNNESLADTFIDLANYAALWGGYRTQEKK